MDMHTALMEQSVPCPYIVSANTLFMLMHLVADLQANKRTNLAYAPLLLQVRAFVAALKGLQRVQSGIMAFQPVLDSISSPLLRSLVTPGESFPDMQAALQELIAATDWDEAEKSGRVIPVQVLTLTAPFCFL